MRIAGPIAKCLGVLLLTSVLGYGVAHTDDRAQMKLVYSTDFSPANLPYFVAKSQGWFEKNGVSIDEEKLLGDSNSVRLIMTGGGDVTQVGLITALDAVLGGAKLKVIGAWQPIVDYQIIAGKNVGTKLQDLAGKTIATYDNSDMTSEIPKMILMKNKVDITNEKFLATQGFHAARLQAVAAGKADASMVSTLVAKQGIAAGSVNIVAAVHDDFPLMGYAFLITTDTDLADPAKRKALKLFLKGSILGARFIVDHTDEASQILIAGRPDLPPDLVKSVMADLVKMKVYGVNGGIDRDVIDYNVKLSVDLKMLASPVKYEEVADRSLVDEILKEIGTR